MSESKNKQAALQNTSGHISVLVSQAFEALKLICGEQLPLMVSVSHQVNEIVRINNTTALAIAMDAARIQIMQRQMEEGNSAPKAPDAPEAANNDEKGAEGGQTH